MLLPRTLRPLPSQATYAFLAPELWTKGYLPISPLQVLRQRCQGRQRGMPLMCGTAASSALKRLIRAAVKYNGRAWVPAPCLAVPPTALVPPGPQEYSDFLVKQPTYGTTTKPPL